MAADNSDFQSFVIMAAEMLEMLRLNTGFVMMAAGTAMDVETFVMMLLKVAGENAMNL